MAINLLPFAAGILSFVLAAAGVFRRRHSVAAWCFVAGMSALALESVFTGFRLRAVAFEDAVSWIRRESLVEAFLPVIWLAFSLTYSRRNYREFLARWKVLLLAALLLPVAHLVLFHGQQFRAIPADAAHGVWALQIGPLVQALNVLLVISFTIVLMNLEQTFRSAVGTMRWRLKFVVLAVGVIFGARLYVRIQGILFAGSAIALWPLQTGALLVACLLLIVAYARTRLAESDVYPSLAVIRSSLTMIVVGLYLLLVGVLARVSERFQGGALFQLQAIVVLVGVTTLAVLLLSDRARQRLHAFVGRHFRRAQHDSTRVWTLFSRQLSGIKDQNDVCLATARLISETFDALSVNIWALDDGADRLILEASTAKQASEPAGDSRLEAATDAVVGGLRARSSPFDLDSARAEWLEEFRRLNPSTFAKGGNRLCVPFAAEGRSLGAIVLADRINGALYTGEELDLLRCIADQMTSVLMNHRLSSEVVQARELEAFRTMSVFFVHDLKNAASSLKLMLKNLSVHFDDPQFRQDALRALANTVQRIDETIARLGALRERPAFSPSSADLNGIVTAALDKVDRMPDVQITTALQPIPAIVVDHEQIQNVVTNLVLNARDAIEVDGHIQIRTGHRDGRVFVSVTDNGCGMSQAFVNESLFRPFQSTKKKGLGIGLFQSRAIVQAHGGAIRVQTEPGAGTTFEVTFPVAAEAADSAAR